jgi:hypothetical protein
MADAVDRRVALKKAAAAAGGAAAVWAVPQVRGIGSAPAFAGGASTCPDGTMSQTVTFSATSDAGCAGSAGGVGGGVLCNDEIQDQDVCCDSVRLVFEGSSYAISAAEQSRVTFQLPEGCSIDQVTVTTTDGGEVEWTDCSGNSLGGSTVSPITNPPAGAGDVIGATPPLPIFGPATGSICFDADDSFLGDLNLFPNYTIDVVVTCVP